MNTYQNTFETVVETTHSNKAAKFLAGVDGPIRHQRRVEDTLNTAEAAAVDAGEYSGGGDVREWARTVMVLDAIGVGGPKDCGGGGTLRFPLFQGLGKGRKQASDGEVWMAALNEAIQTSTSSYRSRLRPQLCTYYEGQPSECCGVEIVDEDEGGETAFVMREVEGSWRWVRAAARLALWHIAYRDGLVETEPPQSEKYLDLSVSMEDWALLLEKAEQQAAVDEATAFLRSCGFSVALGCDHKKEDWRVEAAKGTGGFVTLSGPFTKGRQLTVLPEYLEDVWNEV